MAASGGGATNELCFCRCCLAAGCDKDLLSPYLHSGVEEVYADMMKETFDIEFPNTATDDAKTLHICEDCIAELRRASAFKKCVIVNRDAFNQHFDKISRAGSHKKTTMKQEKVQCEAEDGDRDKNESVHFDEIFYEDYSQPPMKSEYISKRRTLRPSKRKMKQETECEKRTERVKTEERKRQRPEKRDDSKQTADVKMIQKHASSEQENEKGASKGEKNWARIAERRGNGPLLRENSLKLLANSTMCVFQWNKSRYRCFCCKEPYSDMTSLRTHTDTAHSLAHIEKTIIQQQNRLVKVEVSTLFCKLCSLMLSNIDELRTHLETSHGLEFKLCNEDLLVPFKLGSDLLQCQLCSEKFTVFRLLNIHMNKHYKKQVCHVCGAAFSNLVFLNLHKSRSHRVLRCTDCDVEFGSRSEKRAHDVATHKVRCERKLRFPCPFCQDRFFQEKCRVQHLVERHGMARPEHACERCGKVFITKSLRNNHVKSVHQLKARSAECALCLKRFSSRSDVTRHMVTHTRLRSFACAACAGVFATRDSLRRHLKRSCGAGVIAKARPVEPA